MTPLSLILLFFFFNDTATTEIYTLSLHDALPIWRRGPRYLLALVVLQVGVAAAMVLLALPGALRSEEHTSELQSQSNLVCRLLLEKKKKNNYNVNLRMSLTSLYILSSFWCSTVCV